VTGPGVGSGALLAERRRRPWLTMNCVPTPRFDLGLRNFVHPASCECDRACDTEAAKPSALASNAISSRASNRNLSTTSRLNLAVSELSVSPCVLRIATFLPANVKDEPRRELARRVPQSELDSDSSFRSTFGRTRRDSYRRWLWRLVRPFLSVSRDLISLGFRRPSNTANTSDRSVSIRKYTI